MNGFATVQLRHLFEIVSGSTPESGNPAYWDGDIAWVTPEDVSQVEGNVLRDTRRKLTTEGFENSGTTMARSGGIVLTKRAPIGQLALLGIDACSNQGCFLLSARQGTEPRFFYYVLANSVPLLQALGRGSTFMELSTDDLKALRVPVIDYAKQLKIADYLDATVTKVDELLRSKRELLGILAEKRKAIIATAAIRGLDPGAKLRDTGISWLGKIPAHWELKRAKWIFTERDQRSVSGEEVLLSLRMDRGLVPHNEVSPKQTRSEELIGYKHVSPGELVVNRMRASMGLIAVSPEEGLVSPDYAVFRVDSGVHVAYYDALFRTDLVGSVFRSESTGLGTGSSGFLRLYSENFLALWLPSPPADEQQAIIDHIASETSKLDAVRTETERTIGLLHERRAAIIAAAVTGQLDHGKLA